MIAVYFKFRRFWSVRNLDLVGLILFAPGLLLVLQHGREIEGLGGQALGRGRIRHNRESDQGREKGDLGNQTRQPGEGLLQKTGDGKEKSEDKLKPDRQLEQRGYLWLFVVGGFFLFACSSIRPWCGGRCWNPISRPAV